MKVSLELAFKGIFGVAGGAVAGAFLAAIIGGVAGLVWGAIHGFGVGMVLGWGQGSMIGILLGGLVGASVALWHAGGDFELAVPHMFLFGIPGAGIGYVVVGVLGALIVGAQHAVTEAAQTSQAWALFLLPFGAIIGMLVGAVVVWKVDFELWSA